MGYETLTLLPSNIYLSFQKNTLTMKFYLTPFLAAIAATTISLASINRVDASIARSAFSQRSFGLSSSVLNKIPRGGAEVEDPDAPEVHEVLYLPGLLEASIVKNAQVRC